MQHETHAALADIRSKVGKEYGKLVQKLLAASFLDSQVEKLVERSTQGIDLEMVIAGETYAFEVKTSEGDSIRLGKKDIEGLDRLVELGQRVYIAVLPNGLLDEWIFARYYPGEILADTTLGSFCLRAYQDSALQQRIAVSFPAMVEKHANRAITRRQDGLNEVLALYPEWGRA